MTTAHHTDIVFGASATPATINSPLGELDAAIVALDAAIGGTALPVTTTDATAAAGQMVVPVTATTGFVVGQSIWIGDIAGTFETRVIGSIQAGVSLTVTANLTGTYAAGKIVSASPSELVEARDGKATLHSRIRAAGGTSGTAFPGSPATNDICVRTDRGGSRYVYGGAAWTQVDVPAAVAFWGGPSTNDRVFRSDLGIEFFWDGTRWLSTTLYREVVASGTINAAGDVGFLVPWFTTYSLWIEELFWATKQAPTGYYNVGVDKVSAALVHTQIHYCTTNGDTANTWNLKHSVVRTGGFPNVFDPATDKVLSITTAWSGSGGALQVSGAISYRLIG